MSKLSLAIGVLLLAYGALLALLYFRQEALIFPGSKLPADFRFAFDVPFEEVVIPVPGAELSALHFRQPQPRGVIFFLHGNGGNLEGWTENIDYYRRVNYDLFIIDYRGYGKSSGRYSSQRQIEDDVRAAWHAMQQRYDTPIPVVLYGRSLGAALAATLATEVDAELLVLVSPFTSMVAMAARHYPYVPSALLRYPFRTDRIIDRIETPILLIHGSEDRFIPPQQSETLRDLAAPGTRLLVIEGADHNDIHTFAAYLDGLAAALP